MSDEKKMIVGRMVKEKFTMAGMNSPLLRKEPERTLEPSSVKPMRRVNASPAASKKTRPGVVFRMRTAKSSWMPTPMPTRRQSIAFRLVEKAAAMPRRAKMPNTLMTRSSRLAPVSSMERTLVAASAAGAASP